MIADQAERRRAYLIVGASGTIGAAVARQLAGREVMLGLHYRRHRDVIDAIGRDLSKLGCQWESFSADLESEAACERLVDDFFSRWGRMSGMAICHGEVNWRLWDELSWGDWLRVMKQHCLAPFTLVEKSLPLMARGRWGRVAYLSSISPKYAGSAKSLHYAAAKGALEIAMRGLAREAATSGVCINGVRAGFVLTPQQTAGRTPEEIAERVKKIPAGRAGTPEEIAAAFAYLMSETSGFMTGEIVTVAGGD